MAWVDLVAVLALVQFVFFAALVGQARTKYGVKAPAISGHPMFERLYRVQMNTLEMLLIYLPSLYMAARYWSPLLVAGVGVVYVLGRFVYWRAYAQDPAKRAVGYAISVAPTLILLGGAGLGALRATLG
ncbi:MAG: MAPEG family protein [Burkholderiales bacterium]|nr:MAPEG family protein [Burkholderiales bacterium]